VLAAAPGAAAKGPLRGEVPFELVHDLVVVQARVNGRGPFRMLIDTGTSPSAVDLGQTAKMGLALGEAGSASGAGAGKGEIPVRMTSFATLELGPLRAADVEALAVDLAGLSTQLGQSIVAVLGYSLLQGQVVQFDFPQGKLRFLERFVPPRAVRGQTATLPFRLSGAEAPLVEGVVVKNHKATALLDTGASGALLFTSDGVRRLGLGAELARARPTRGSGYGGTFSLVTGKVDGLRIGSIVIEGLPSSFPPRGSGHDDEAYDVNIGNGAMKKFVVTFDYRNNIVSFATPSAL
jgi:predicted aspartyl protease